MSQVFGHMVVKNEADRYLEEVLEWHSRFLDGMFVFDDNSTDDTPAIASEFAEVGVNSGPSFLENESAFRQNAWTAMAEVLKPSPMDWILAIDADEFFVANSETESEGLLRLLELATLRFADSIDLRIDEIFDVVAGVPRKRVDGFWNQTHGVRLVRFHADRRFRSRIMGGGSTPPGAHPLDARDWHVGLLHYGYARPEDRAAKYHRYNSHPTNGHNPEHIASILTPPVLESVKSERQLP